MEQFVINHVPTLGLLLVFLYRFEYDGNVIDGYTAGGGIFLSVCNDAVALT